MTEFPDDLKLALAELPREREPDPALEDRVVRAVFPSRRPWVWAGVAAAAAALLLVIAHPWSPTPATGQTYVLLLSQPAGYIEVPPGQLHARRTEYARWADSLAHLGKLQWGAALEGPQQAVDGLFIIRAANDSDAAAIAATCPHNKYRGHVEVRRAVGTTD